MRKIKETPRVRFLKHKEDILSALAAGHTQRDIRKALGWSDIPTSTFSRQVNRLKESVADRRPPTKLSLSSSSAISEPANLASTSYSASISRLEDIEFTPARKGDADRLFKRARNAEE